MNKLNLTDKHKRILPQLLTQQAQQNPQGRFLITDERTLTFSETEQLANQLAQGLLSLRVNCGDRVAFYLNNGIDIFIIAMACNKIGAIWIPVNTDYKGDWLLSALLSSKARIIITESTLQERILRIADALNNEQIIINGNATSPDNTIRLESLYDNIPLVPDYSQIHYGDTSAIMWTSGTTGKAKGVMQSHNSWLRPVVDAVSIYYDSQPGDVIYNVLPLFNSGAWTTSILRALYEGLPVVLETQFSVTSFWERVKHFGATQTFTLGAMHMFLWNAPATEHDRNNPLRIALMVPMPETIKDDFSERFDIQLLPMGYGQSECMVICTPVNCMNQAPFASLGLPLDDIQLALLNEQGVQVDKNDIGEFCIRPLEEHVIFNAYFDDVNANTNAFIDGWYHTGDLGKQDENGYYWFVDRKSDILRFAGRNISSLQVEYIVHQHPDIANVAAFGIASNDIAGESELKLDIVLKPDVKLSYETIAQYINDNAPYYFVPQYMEFVDTLPYTPTNKVQKYKLRQKGITSNTWILKQSGYTIVR